MSEKGAPMKKSLIMIAALIFLGYPFMAHAVHDLVFISTIVKFSETECAIELEISGDNQNGFVDEDSIKLNGEVLVSLMAVIDAGINEEGGANDTGDTILATSDSFDTANGIDGDLTIADGKCAEFDQDAVFGFFINGDEEIDAIDASEFDGFGNNKTAIFREAVGKEAKLLDLTDTGVQLFNNAGVSVVVGSSEGSTNPTNERKGTIKCSLLINSPLDKGSNSTPFILLGFYFLGIFSLRFARN